MQLNDMTRLRPFQVRYLPPGSKRGARIRIKDLRRGDIISIPFNDDTSAPAINQAIDHLKSLGIEITAIGLSDHMRGEATSSPETIILLTENFHQSIKK